MLSDKVYAISSGNVCRRTKDVLDIYVMSFIMKIDMDELHQIWKESDLAFDTYNRNLVYYLMSLHISRGTYYLPFTLFLYPR